jgi:hypothetical protein
VHVSYRHSECQLQTLLGLHSFSEVTSVRCGNSTEHTCTRPRQHTQCVKMQNACLIICLTLIYQFQTRRETLGQIQTTREISAVTPPQDCRTNLNVTGRTANSDLRRVLYSTSFIRVRTDVWVPRWDKCFRVSGEQVDICCAP